MSLSLKIRELRATDIDNCIALFQEAVHTINAADYNQVQLNAWAPKVKPTSIDNYPYWLTLQNNISYVAEYDNHLVGFGDLTNEGYLDRLFVHKDYQRTGVATSILKQLLDRASKLNIKEITTEASITAKSFFDKFGFKVVKEQQVKIRGEKLTNFLMKKDIINSLPYLNSFEEYETFKQKVEILENVAKEIAHQHRLPETPLILFSDGTNVVFAHGQQRVIKIFPPFHQDQFTSELLVLKILQGKLSVMIPVIECSGEIYGWPYIVMTQLEGTPLEKLWETMEHSNKLVIIGELGALIREVHSVSTQGLEEIDCHWEEFINKQISKCMEHHRSLKLSELLINEIPNYISSIKNSLTHIQKPVILTGEYTPMNFLVKQVLGVWHIAGLIDFGDAMLGLPEYDLLGPGAFLIQGDKQLLKEFLSAYGYSQRDLTEKLSHKLTALMLLHRYSNLKIQVRIDNWELNIHSLKDLENLIWGF